MIPNELTETLEILDGEIDSIDELNSLLRVLGRMFGQHGEYIITTYGGKDWTTQMALKLDAISRRARAKHGDDHIISISLASVSILFSTMVATIRTKKKRP